MGSKSQFLTIISLKVDLHPTRPQTRPNGTLGPFCRCLWTRLEVMRPNLRLYQVRTARTPPCHRENTLNMTYRRPKIGQNALFLRFRSPKCVSRNETPKVEALWASRTSFHPPRHRKNAYLYSNTRCSGRIWHQTRESVITKNYPKSTSRPHPPHQKCST